jgi:polysaccharide pyruvyl transferase WcaK-like protein
MTKICIWGAWYESKNAGDQAILMSIAGLFSTRISNLDFVVFSNRPRFTREYMSSTFQVRAISHRHNLTKVLRELISCDLFLVGGGTPFYDDIFHLIAMFLLISTTRLAGRPVMAYAVSARPIKSILGKLIAKINLSLVNAISVREPLSKSILQDLGIKKDINLFTDPAVTLQPIENHLAAKILTDQFSDSIREPLIAICPHFFTPDNHYYIHHYEKFEKSVIENYHRSIAKAADRLSEKGQILFIPLNTEEPDDDRVTIKQIIELMANKNRCFTFENQYGPRELIGILNQCELLLAVRLHAAVLGSSASTPVVAISYGPKVEGFMKQINQSEYVLKFDTLSEEDLTCRLLHVWDNRKCIRKDLERSLDSIRNLAERNVDMAISQIFAC